MLESSTPAGVSKADNAKAMSVTKPALSINKYTLHCNFGKNNTHMTLTAEIEDLNFLERKANLTYNQKVLYYLTLPQKVVLSHATGHFGFRKAQRGEYEAAFQTATAFFKKMEERGFLDKPLELVLSEFGKGRQAFVAALEGKEGNKIRDLVVRVSDHTKVKFGGNRSPRRRRL